MCKIYICYLIKSTIALHKQSGYTYGHEASICENMYIVLNNIIYDNTNKTYNNKKMQNSDTDAGVL